MLAEETELTSDIIYSVATSLETPKCKHGRNPYIVVMEMSLNDTWVHVFFPIDCSPNPQL